MKLVIAGAGEVGFHLIENLCKEDLDILAVDTDGEVLKKLSSEYGIKTDQSNIIDSRFLSKSYLENVDLFLAITNSDETNMIACKTASDAGAKQTICRIRQVDFSRSKKQVSLKSLGIDYIINPVSLVAEEIFHLVMAPNIVDRHEFMNGGISLLGFKIQPFSNVRNNTVAGLQKTLDPFDIQIGIIRRRELSLIPHKELVIEAGDIVYFFCRSEDMERLRFILGYQHKKKLQKRIFINGGGHIGVRLARKLENENHIVKIIEKETFRSYRISEALQKTLVLNFDGTDLKQLVAEGIENADYFISVTDNESINLTSCLLAADNGVERSICLVHQPEFTSIISEKTPIHLGISPRVLTTRHLARFIQESNVQSYFPLQNSHIAVLELHLNDLTPCLDVPLKDLQFPDDVMIGLIIRDKQVILPKGDHTLLAGDTILLTLHRLDRKKAMQFFQPLSF